MATCGPTDLSEIANHQAAVRTQIKITPTNVHNGLNVLFLLNVGMDVIPFDVPSAAIPFVVMQGTANERAISVLLDTGTAAPFAVIVSEDFAAQQAPAGSRATSSSSAVGDERVELRTSVLRQFQLGTIQLKNVEVGVSSALALVSSQIGTKIDAIVGHRFVDGRRIAIDYGARTVDFAAPIPQFPATTVLSIAPGRPLTLVSAMLNRAGPFTLAVDTGASSTLISPRTAIAAGIAAGEAARLGGAGGVSGEGARLGSARIELGNIARDALPIAIADVLTPVEAAAQIPLDGVLGADFFRGMRLTLDYRSRETWLERSR